MVQRTFILFAFGLTLATRKAATLYMISFKSNGKDTTII
jgi:hypothetical protein